MIKTEYLFTREDGVRLFKTYSNEKFYIIQEQTGIKYGEAVDVENSGYTYIESDEKMPDEEHRPEEFEEMIHPE